MTLPEGLEGPLGAAVAGARPVAGGSINDAWRLALESGEDAFLKTRAGARMEDFEAEAAGLAWLAEAGAPVPAVLGLGAGPPPWLALEWVEPGALRGPEAEELGRALAKLHAAGAGAHGELPPGCPDRTLRLGSVEVELAEGASWPEVYAGSLLVPLTARARDAGRLGAGEARAIEAVCERLELVAGPGEPPARLHGDLWSGNVHPAADGPTRMVDPAAYGGHREMDLAMLRLFGSPSPAILDAYAEAHPLADGHADRVELWQLLPLLVHAILFDGSYGAAAGRAAARYA